MRRDGPLRRAELRSLYSDHEARGASREQQRDTGLVTARSAPCRRARAMTLIVRIPIMVRTRWTITISQIARRDDEPPAFPSEEKRELAGCLPESGCRVGRPGTASRGRRRATAWPAEAVAGAPARSRLVRPKSEPDCWLDDDPGGCCSVGESGAEHGLLLPEIGDPKEKCRVGSSQQAWRLVRREMADMSCSPKFLLAAMPA